MNAPFMHTFEFSDAGVLTSEEFNYTEQNEVRSVEVTLDLSAITGTTPTLDVVPQYSYGDGVWYDETAFAQLVAAGSETLSPTNFGVMMRFKATLGGTATPTATAKVKAITK